MDEFSRLSEWIRAEREAESAHYRDLMDKSPVGDRRENGLTWYPVVIVESEPGKGDYLTITLERTGSRDIASQFRPGGSASIFSGHDPAEDRLAGTIAFLSGDRMGIALRVDELPKWTKDGKLGVDLLFDNNSFDEMERALQVAEAVRGKDRLVRVLLGEEEPRFSATATTSVGSRPSPAATATGPRSPAPATLNAAQFAAVSRVLAAQDLSVIHGPPGTGKTTTLVCAIQAQLSRDPSQVLVTAPSNAAVDLLTERLSEAGLRVLRIGNPARISPRLSTLTLDGQVAAHPGTRAIKKLKKQVSEYLNLAQKYKRNFGPAEREQRKALLDEARKLRRDVDKAEQSVEEELLGRARILTATLVGAAHPSIRDRRYPVVFIDEAGQALEPACWIPILKASKVVLAGDHCQLPPTILSGDSRLSVTLLEKCTARFPEAVTLLEEQYRMHEVIMGFPSRTFYDNRLRAHPSVSRRTLFPGDEPLLFVDTAGCGFEEKAEGTAMSNPEEAAFVLRHLEVYLGVLHAAEPPEVSTSGAIKPPVVADLPSVAVIAPYRHQVTVLQELRDHSPALAAWGDRLSINTIDSFQGQERDIVYISLTRSNTDNKIGFLSEIRRMNVAMTRARQKLVVVGDSATLGQAPFYADFMDYAAREGAYRSAWEWMV